MHPLRLVAAALAVAGVLVGCKATVTIVLDAHGVTTFDMMSATEGDPCEAGSDVSTISQERTTAWGIDACHRWGTLDAATASAELPLTILPLGDRLLVVPNRGLEAAVVPPVDAPVDPSQATEGDWQVTLTFPGAVVEQAGGTVSGNSVTWTWPRRGGEQPYAIGLTRPGPTDEQWAGLAGLAAGAIGVSGVLALRGRRGPR